MNKIIIKILSLNRRKEERVVGETKRRENQYNARVATLIFVALFV